MTLMLLDQREKVGPPFSRFRDLDDARTLYSADVTTATPGQPSCRLDVRLATSDTDRTAARQLINHRYEWRGYGNSHVLPARQTHSTFVAALDDEIVGTVTLAVDSPAGLAADTIFRDEINSYRRVPGASVCELTKLAFDAEIPSRKLLASLFHIVFIYGRRQHRCTDLFIEVNPRHRRYYEAMLGFKPIGELRTNPGVNAPAQLMWLRVADIAARISEFSGKGEAANSRSLYPFFLSRSDVRNVHATLSRGLRRNPMPPPGHMTGGAAGMENFA
ncbi:putative acetyltransferase [Sphingobium sp. SYK-6]|nr:putative acetyltransferase [Sphingobium sp. SYK-6]